MPNTRWFELNDDVGINANGNPEPLHNIGVTLVLPTMVDGEVVDVPQRQDVPPIPGTRIFKTDDPLVCQAVLDTGLVHETKAPTKKQLEGERSVTQDAREESGTIEPNESTEVAS